MGKEVSRPESLKVLRPRMLGGQPLRKASARLGAALSSGFGDAKLPKSCRIRCLFDGEPGGLVDPEATGLSSAPAGEKKPMMLLRGDLLPPAVLLASGAIFVIVISDLST
jgi:hypothetical protein